MTKNLFRWVETKPRVVAVLRVVRKPLSTGQIWRAALNFHPELREPDVHQIVKKLRIRDILECLTRKAKTCKIYFLTLQGQWIYERLFKNKIEQPPNDFDWYLYAEIICSPNAKLVLEEMSQVKYLESPPAISDVFRAIKEKWKKGFNSIDRTMHRLVRNGLIEQCGLKDKSDMKIYKLTGSGERVLTELRR